MGSLLHSLNDSAGAGSALHRLLCLPEPQKLLILCLSLRAHPVLPSSQRDCKGQLLPPPPAFSLDFTFVLIWLAVNICPRWGSASPWHAVLSGRAVVPLLEAGKPTLLRLVSAREVRCGLQEAAAAHAFFIALDFCLENITHPTHKVFQT